MIEQGWQKTDTLALAVSGGIDSMVLYHLLTTSYQGSYKNLVLFHVNHGIRKASETEEAYLKESAGQNGLSIEVCHLNMAENFTQHDARTARYQFFDDMMIKHDADILLTAHHVNDREETIMHQLLTGRYTHQYVGIERESVRNGYKVLRPLYEWNKADIKAYSDLHGVRYFEDESNSGSDYTRNYIRHHIMKPVYGSGSLHPNHLTELAEDLNELTSYAREGAVDFLRNHQSRLEKDKLFKETKLQQFYIVKEWFRLQGIHISRKAAAEFLSAADAVQADFEIDGRTAAVRYNDIFMIEDESERQEPLEVTRTGAFYFNGYKVMVHDESLLPVLIRTRKPGDRVSVEHVGTKKVSRIMIDKKIMREERDRLPVVVDKNGRIIALGTIYNIMGTKDNVHPLIIEKEFSHDAEK